MGVGHLLCYEISDRDGEAIARQGLVGLHASFTVSDDTLTKAVALARKYDSGFHIHVAENPIDQERRLSGWPGL